MLLDIQRINVPPGQRVLLQDVTWPELEEILSELGDQRSARIAYNHGTLEIMTPLPEHEFSKEIIGDLLKALLEELDVTYSHRQPLRRSDGGFSNSQMRFLASQAG
jgi:Uma2 family endonuclease